VTSSEDPSSQRAQPLKLDRSGLYKLAYEAGLRTLDDQRDELNGVRTRAGQFISFVGSATAFLVGTSVARAVRDSTFYTVAVPATICTVASIMCLLIVLWPRTFDFRLSPGVLVERWIDRSVPPPSEEDLLRGLAVLLNEMQAANGLMLSRIRLWYVVLAGSGSIGLMLWTLLVWIAS